MLRFAGVIGLVLWALFWGLTGCEEPTPTVDSLRVKPVRTIYTVNEFYSEFPLLSLPVEIYDDEWYNNKVKTIGIAYYDTFVVHPKGLFPEVKGEQVAFGFYGRIANQSGFIPLILVQERKDGSYFYLITLEPDTSRLKVIDKEIIAFRKVSEEYLDVQKAIINLNWQIIAKREYTQVKAPKSIEEAAQMGGVQIKKSEETYRWKVLPDGKIEAID